MKITFTRAPAIGRTQRGRTSSAARLQGLVLAAGLCGALVAGTAGTASAAVRAPVSPALKASTVAAVTASNPPVGSYTGTNPQNNEPITFYVSASKTSLQDISIPYVFLTCTPTGDANPTEPLGIATIPLTSSGSFTATTTQTGVYAGYPAKFTYTFRGNYQGLNSSGVPTVTGTFKETLKFTDSAARTCTSGTQSWTATRDTQPPQTTTPPPAGSYTATNPQNNEPITFYVSASKTSLQDISIPYVFLDCAPKGDANPTEPLGIASAPLKTDGSFTATTTQTGVYAGYPAKFTYTFRGNFHGAGPTGAARAAGTFQETMTFTDSTARTCTSNIQSWTAARDAQPPQTTTPPPAGGYTGTNPQNNEPITFSVSSSRTRLQNISIPFVFLDCSPPGDANPTEPLGIASAPLKSDRSFTATTTQTGVYLGHPAKFTYTFRGNFHGVAPSGAARAAGTFQETMTFTDSTARTCTSNLQSWTATRNS
jgi:hypothetical protein